MLDLSRTPVVPCLWKNNYGGLFSMIGKNIEGDLNFIDGTREDRRFKASSNHLNSYIYPVGVTLINNGNHSQFTAMIKGERKTKFYQFYDYIY